MVPDSPRAKRQAAQAKAFDQIGAAYDQAFPHKEGQLTTGEWLIEKLRPGASVLDVGCGTGLPTARQLVDAKLEVTGIDISERMLQLAHQNVPEATFVRLDIADLDGIDLRGAGNPLGPFDAIVNFFCLPMLPRVEIPWTLRKLRDLLRPGGYFVLGMVEADLDDAPIVFLGNAVRISGYPRGELRTLVAEAGFEVLDLTSAAYTPKAEVPPEIQLFLHCRRADH